MSGPQVAFLSDGDRLHLQHGPIDLIVKAFGPGKEVNESYIQLERRFRSVLAELVSELNELRKPVTENSLEPEGLVARRMMDAVIPHREDFVTPMAAVAGAVADELIASMVIGHDIEKAYINNSGDLAIYLSPGESLRLGIVSDLLIPRLIGGARLVFEHPVRGIATSGWRGRSWSFGIADSVTVLASNSAAADVAATLIGNAVYADDAAVKSVPASDVDDNTDLGDRLVTVDVGRLKVETVKRALSSGANKAGKMLQAGLIFGAVLVLKDEVMLIGDVPALTSK